jgi:serine/threonine-protein kinase
MGAGGDTLIKAAMLLETGQVIESKYRITRLIGTGGMGAVYEGENVLIRRRVAIKVLHADTTGNADIIRRFEREAQAAGEIGNDHILEVLDLGSLPNGDRFMVMEYLDGETLAQRIERFGRLTPAQLAPIASQFLTALVSAHAAGIIHRDLKPENIFILRSKAGRADFVKLIDFGVSKFSRPFKEGEQRMTRANAVLGTPCYMSPEQARGASETDVRSDIYSCGVMLFEAVTGRLPFDGDSFNDLMFKIALEDAPDVRSIQPELDPEFARIIMRAIARDPGNRFPSALDFSTELDVWMRRNKLTDSLGEASAPVPAASARMAIDRGVPTMSLEQGEAVAPGAGTTGTHGSWASQSGADAQKEPKRSRTVPILVGSVAALAALAIGIGAATRARPTASPAGGGLEGPNESAHEATPALPPPPPTAVASAAEPPQTLAPIPSADLAASTAPATHKVAPPGAAPRPVAQPPPSHAKPKPGGGSGGFDFGY